MVLSGWGMYRSLSWGRILRRGIIEWSVVKEPLHCPSIAVVGCEYVSVIDGWDERVWRNMIAGSMVE